MSWKALLLLLLISILLLLYRQSGYTNTSIYLAVLHQTPLPHLNMCVARPPDAFVVLLHLGSQGINE